MICPKCKVEYRKGYVTCSDCNVKLIPNNRPIKAEKEISKKGIKIVKYGLALLLATLIELVFTIIAYEFYWVYMLNNGGVYGTAIQNVHPLIWLVIVIQIIISLVVVKWGFGFKDDSTNESKIKAD